MVSYIELHFEKAIAQTDLVSYLSGKQIPAGSVYIRCIYDFCMYGKGISIPDKNLTLNEHIALLLKIGNDPLDIALHLEEKNDD